VSFLQPYISRLLPMFEELDDNFRKISRIHGREVTCKAGCDDCCHYPFDIRLVEAVYICEGVRELAAPLRSEVRRRAAEAMEQLRAKDSSDDTLTRGEMTREDMARRTLMMSGIRVPCPAIVDRNCAIYGHRPGICRIFGVPLTIVRGQPAVSCAMCGFKPNSQYVSFVMTDFLTHLDDVDRQLMTDLAGRPPATAFRTSIAAAICVDYDVEKVRRVAVRLAGEPTAAAASC